MAEIGLPAVVVAGDGALATPEAASLLRLNGHENHAGALLRMFGIRGVECEANPVHRALRSREVVNGKMLITDGSGAPRLIEVTTLPAKHGGVVILLRDPTLNG